MMSLLILQPFIVNEVKSVRVGPSLRGVQEIWSDGIKPLPGKSLALTHYMCFLLIGWVFIRARSFLFLANPNKNSFHPMGNFCTRKLTFSSRKFTLFVKKMPFNVQCKTFITIRNDKKIVLCFGQDFLAFGPFLGFFWPSEGLRPPSGQKNPKNGPQAKKPGCSTIFFVLPHVDIVLHFNVEIYHFYS